MDYKKVLISTFFVACVQQRRILKMIWKWLKAGVMEDGKYMESELGSPQGGVISPLLANIYLHYFDLKWELHYKHLGKLIRYCDDFVIICRTKKEAEHALKAVKSIMQRQMLMVAAIITVVDSEIVARVCQSKQDIAF